MSRQPWHEPSPSLWSDPNHEFSPLQFEILSRRFASAAAARAFVATTTLSVPAGEPLPNMDAAIARLGKAIRAGERVAIFGDYDVDGLAASAELKLAIEAASAGQVVPEVYLPNRQAGYGLRPETIAEIAAMGASLLVCVDCGSSDFDNLTLAREHGLDVVVFDHHRLNGELPPGIIVTPRLDEEGPYAVMSAAGVVYLAAIQLARAGFDIGAGAGVDPDHLADLAMLGTVADVMPLVGVNRGLVRDGLSLVRDGPRPGVLALLKSAGVDQDKVTSEDVAFKLAPRLNAAGRMGDVRVAFDLLLAESPPLAARGALTLGELNQRRKDEGDRIERAAILQVMQSPAMADLPVVVVHADNWSAGVLGIVAARLVERFGKPSLVLADDADGISRGSARSVSGFDIGEAIAEVAPNLLLAHGGHPQAAGLTVETARIPELAECLRCLATTEQEQETVSGLTFDADLPFDQLTMATVMDLGKLGPFGAGNPRPLFRVRAAPVKRYDALGATRRHLKVALAGPKGEISVLAWGAAERSRELLGAQAVDLVVTLGVDHWNGSRRLKVEAKDFRPAE